MDTSKEYIDMCSKAVEVQELQKLKVGDWIAYRKFNNIVDVIDRFSKWDNKDMLWLPRQDQLQGMLAKYNDYEHWYETFQDFLHFYGNCDISHIESMEQLWLAFVQRELYQRKWDGKDWVKETGKE